MDDALPHGDRKTWTSARPTAGAVQVPADTRGLRYGDGVFVTLGIRGGILLDARLQLARLRRAAREIGLAPPPDFERRKRAAWLLGALLNELGAGPGADGVARIQWHAGAGGRGYGRRDTQAEALVDLGPAPAPRRPAIAILEPHEAPLPALPRWKTCSALAHVVCERSAHSLGADTGVRTHDGILLEAGSANLFWLEEGRLRTPSADLPLYAGSVRERVMESALDAGLAVEEGSFGPEALAEADAVILTSAARGLEFAGSVDGRVLPEPTELALALAEDVAARRAAAGIPLGAA